MAAVVWVEEAEQLCKIIWNKTSAFIKSVRMMNKKELSEISRDSAISCDTDFEDEPYTTKSTPWSRSSSISSICSCAACCKVSDWKRRPSRLLEDYNVEDFYRFDAVLGEGSFSTVYLGESRAHQGGMVAIKVVEKHSLLKTKSIPNPNTDDIIYEEDEDSINSISVMEEKLEKHDQEIMRLVDKEIRIMSALDHPHVIHLEEVYEDTERVCFVMELAQGGEVFDRLVEQVSFDEMQTADLIVQLLCAMSYIHSQGIVHRDLKLENLLYYDDTLDSRIMVADFGLSDWVKILEDGTSPICGTPGYMAPEVISRQSCTTKSDVWSIGVITYILLAGYPPFHVDHDTSNASDADAILLKKILNCDYKFIDATWKDISPQAIDFIQTLMCPDANLRPSCDEALSHPWLTDRQNLEERAAERKRKSSLVFSQENGEEWSMGQQVAFIVSVLVILGSYTALITYVFNIGKPCNVILAEFMSHMKLEYEDFSKIYNNVYATIENCIDKLHNMAVKVTECICWKT